MKKVLQGIVILAFFLIPNHATGQQPVVRSKPKSTHNSNVETTAGSWLFSLYPNNILKATFTPVGSSRNEQVSDAVIAKAVMISPTIKRGENKTTVSFGNILSAQVNNTGVEFNAGNSNNISLVNIFYSNEHRGFRFSLMPGEMIFGTGERSIPLNRRGYKLPLNNAPAYGYSLNAESLNYCVPFILSSRGYAIFFDNPSTGFFDIGKSVPDLLEYSVTSGELSFYIIPGKNYQEIIESYHRLVGTAPLPPRWAMGNLMSRFGYRDEKQTRLIIAQMQKDSVPLDAVIFDLFWFGDSIKNTLGNLSWVNKKAWPNPEKMIRDFSKQHIKTILITEPFVLKTSLNYEESKHLHATDSAGNPYVLQEFYFGKGGIIDLFRKDAQKWFYSKYKTQMNIGVTGWWGDLGEPENHPANVYHDLKDLGFKRKFASGEIHNIYGHYWSKMLAEQYKKDYPNQRLFHLNRSGYAGSPRYSSFPWSGDVSRSWDGLKGQLPLIQGMSISGIPYIHTDAGGFAGGDGDPELYVRWLQFAVFTPIYRPHGTALGDLEAGGKDIPSEAALWPEPTKSLAKAAAQQRYQWLAYNYNLSYLQTRYGKPLITPMFFLNSHDSNLYKAADQYMWGDEVMVVPITGKGQKIKTYYVPAGAWTNLHTMQIRTGPEWITDSSFGMESIPVLAKEGSFIPRVNGLQNTSAYNTSTLEIIYVPSAGPSTYKLYEDDGNSAIALKGKKYEITGFSCSGMSKLTQITIVSDGGNYKGRINQRKIHLRIINAMKKPTEITINGKSFTANAIWNNERKDLLIPFIFEHKKTQIQINFK